MKKKLSKITKDLKKGKITKKEARTLLLCLLGVSGSSKIEPPKPPKSRVLREGEEPHKPPNYR